MVLKSNPVVKFEPVLTVRDRAFVAIGDSASVPIEFGCAFVATVDFATVLIEFGCVLVATVDCAHMLTGDAKLRGFGVAAMKSALLFSVSVQPSDLRMTALVLLAAGAGALPLKQVALAP